MPEKSVCLSLARLQGCAVAYFACIHSVMASTYAAELLYGQASATNVRCIPVLSNSTVCREKATGAPHRSLPLDNIISSMIEPTLTQEDRDRRAASKAQWQKQADKTTARWKQAMNPTTSSHMRMPAMGPFGMPGERNVDGCLVCCLCCMG